MVLRLCAVALVLWGGAGCLNKVPPQRLAARAPIAVAFAIDELDDAPEVLKARVFEVLDSRNLEAREVPASALQGQRLSAERFRALQAAARDAPFALLIEARAQFFTQLNGRFRWTVSTKFTVGRAGTTPPSQDSGDFPALMQFEHEKQAAALDDVREYIANRVTTLVDGLLAGMATVDGGVASADRNFGPLYLVMVDRFADGDRANDGPQVSQADPDASYGGDLAGVRAHLDWLAQLGVGAVWLTPVFAMRSEPFHGWAAWHGYWVDRLDALEPGFGTLVELRGLRDALRARGMGLMLDLVLNHVGPETSLTRAHPEWFHGRGSITDWNDPQQLVMNDVQGLPDLAVERDDVYAYLLESTLKWVRAVRPTGLRLDAVKHLPVSFWARFNASVLREAGPGFTLLGEDLDGDPAEVARIWREGAFTAMFDFPLRFALIDVVCRGASPARLGAVLSDDRRYPDPAALVTLLDNHDLPRLATECGAHSAEAVKLLYALRGTPSITWGTEVGLEGEKEPQNRGVMRFDAHAPMRAALAQAAALRRAHPSLREGALQLTAANERSFTFRRVSDFEIASVTVEQQQVKVQFERGDFRAEAALANRQWRTGERKRRVELSGPPDAVVVGSGPELGGWKLERALSLPAAAELPIGGVFELKLWSKARTWESGPNRVLFVADGQGPLKVDLQWRGT